MGFCGRFKGWGYLGKKWPSQANGIISLQFGIDLQKLDVRSSIERQLVKVKFRNLEAWIKILGRRIPLMKEEKMGWPVRV